MEETNATPTEGGASTLDRIERYLSGQETPQPTQEVQASATPEPVEPADDGDEPVNESQLTTSDLAKVLGIDEDVLDVDEDGTLKVRTKIDGKDGAAKLADLLKSYQLEGHVNKKSMELSEREKAFQARAQEVEQQFAQKLQYAEGLANVAAHQLMQEFQSINWQALEQQDPGHAALLRQKFQDKQAQLRGVFHNIEQNKGRMQQSVAVQNREALAKEAQRLPELIPEWKDEAIANKERGEIREWALKAGWQADEVDNISRAHHVAVLRKAMLADRLQSKKPDIENRVRQAPKLVKPGQPTGENSKEQTLRNLKQAVIKSGGRRGVADYLIASGKV